MCNEQSVLESSIALDAKGHSNCAPTKDLRELFRVVW